MKKRPGLFAVQAALLALVLVVVFLLSRTVDRGPYDTVAGFAQGTTYHITYNSKNQEDLKPLIDSLLDSFNLSLHLQRPLRDFPV